MIDTRPKKCKIKIVDGFLPTLKFVHDCCVTIKIIKKLDDDFFSNNNIIFINEDCNYDTFFNDEMGILSVDLNFDEDDPETSNFSGLVG